MNRSSLRRLEEAAIARGRQADIEADTPRTDEEWVEVTGEFHWFRLSLSKRHTRASESSPDRLLPDHYRNFDIAAHKLWQSGTREWAEARSNLLPFARAIWDALGPAIRQKEQRHGVWVWSREPANLTTSLEDFQAQPLDERIRILRDPGQGHWSRHAPKSSR
jgi:hypothetical protein